MRFTMPAAVVLLLSLSLPPSALAGPLRIEFKDGLVTISATEVPLRQLLTEWARLGQTRIVNVERITGGPLTLELTNVPEKQALEVVLRGVLGYMVAQRGSPVPGRSQFDRIVVMPGVVTPPQRGAAGPPSPQQHQPQMAPPPQPPAYVVDDQGQPVAQDVQEEPPQEEQRPPVMYQPGIQPMAPNQGEGQRPPGTGAAPVKGVVVSPMPGQLPLPPQKPQPQQ